MVMQDCLQGKRVIEVLDVDQEAPGRHQYYFRVSEDGVGQPTLLPVTIFKGDKKGPKLLISAGLHGDELNGVLAVQEMARKLDYQAIKGTIVLVGIMNLPGLLAHKRTFIPADHDQIESDFNRMFPGDSQGSHAQQYVHRLWHRLLLPNADYAIDLHTQTKGTTYPLYVFADHRNQEAVELAHCFEADALVDDAGADGVLESEWLKAGIPAITVEAGEGKRIDSDMVERVVSGLENAALLLGIAEGGEAVSYEPKHWGNSTYSIKAARGGFAIPYVSLGQKIQAGEKVAAQYDDFGDEVAIYHAEKSGIVVSICTDPVRDRGAMLVRLLLA